ncbi:hypothetical protein U1701_05315 [Sphingomonas sp. PB2P19]|uniref:hypothetical protein n=1 Tax=Sphingomonas rhamnosi TaxID=3096156 RepID=UPI002FC677BD
MFTAVNYPPGTCVHVDDLADLYLLALEKAPAAPIFNGAHGAATPLIDIARADSEGAGTEGRVAAWPLEEARQALGGFADAIAWINWSRANTPNVRLVGARRGIRSSMSYAPTRRQRLDRKSPR